MNANSCFSRSATGSFFVNGMVSSGTVPVAVGLLWLATPFVEAAPETPRSDTRLHGAPPPAAPVESIEGPAFQTLTTLSEGPVLYEIGEPTDAEQHYVELINLARAEPQDFALRYATTEDPAILSAYAQFGVDLNLMLDQFDDFDPMPPLAINPKLTEAARGHSQDMADNAFQGHTSSDGESGPGDRVLAENYPLLGVGENVYASADSVWHGHVAFEVDWGEGEEGMEGGMQVPPGHRLLIHEGDFREIGIGVIEGVEGNLDTGAPLGPQVVTQNFANPQEATPFITGVAYYDLDETGEYGAGEGLGGVTVTVEGSDYYAVTSFSGGYAVPVPGDGSYEVTFSAADLPEETKTVTVSDGENVKADLILDYPAPAISGPDVIAVGGTNHFETSAVDMAGGYRWKTARLIDYDYVEGAEEGTDHVHIETSPGYDVVQSAVVASGDNAFHLAQTDDSPAGPQIIELQRDIILGESSELTFQSRLGVATDDQVAQVLLSADGGHSWDSIWEQSGSTGEWGEGEFESRSVSLSSFEGEIVRLRFVYDVAPGGTYYPATDTDPLYGWVVDDIEVTDAEEMVDETATSVDGDTLFSFSPAAAGTYILQAAADVSGREHPFGEILEIDATTDPVAPSITRHPRSVELEEGDPLLLSVAASGSGTLSYQWRKDGQTIPSGTGSGSTYSIPSVSSSDAGTYTVRVSGDAGNVVSDEAVVSVGASPADFEAWRELHFTESELQDLDVSGAGADPGGYGVPNLLRYALDLDPESPDRNALPRLKVEAVGDEAFLALEFRRLKAGNNLEYVVEASDDLLTWDPVSVTVTIIDENEQSETVRATENSPFNDPKRFLRLRVVQE